MIGLYDRDFVDKSTKPIKFNIQLMKISTYYKKKREMVSLITDLSRAPYYTKVFYRQDNPELDFPPELYQYSNIDIGGFGINPVYVPLPDEIEKCEPDTSIYDSHIPWGELSASESAHVRKQMRGNHMMMSLDGVTRNPFYEPLPCDMNPVCCFIYDMVLFPGWKEYLTELQEQYPRLSFAFAHELTLNNFSDLEFMYTLTPNYCTKIYYDGYLTYNQSRKLLEQGVKSWSNQTIFALPEKPLTRPEMYQELINLVKNILIYKAYKKQYLFSISFYLKQPGMICVYQMLRAWSATERYFTSFNYFIANSVVHKTAFNPAERKYCKERIEQLVPELKILFNIEPEILYQNGGILPI